MTHEKPIPPERDALHEYIGKEAARLLSVYRLLAEKGGGSGVLGEKRAAKAAALNLLCEIGAPPSLVSLFDVMLGGVAGASPKAVPWLDVALDYEARAHNEGRLVTNAEIVDKAILTNYVMSQRDTVMRQVRAVRKASWYPEARDLRRVYLMDNPETV